MKRRRPRSSFVPRGCCWLVLLGKSLFVTALNPRQLDLPWPACSLTSLEFATTTTSPAEEFPCILSSTFLSNSNNPGLTLIQVTPAECGTTRDGASVAVNLLLNDNTTTMSYVSVIAGSLKSTNNNYAQQHVQVLQELLDKSRNSTVAIVGTCPSVAAIEVPIAQDYQVPLLSSVDTPAFYSSSADIEPYVFGVPISSDLYPLAYIQALSFVLYSRQYPKAHLAVLYDAQEEYASICQSALRRYQDLVHDDSFPPVQVYEWNSSSLTTTTTTNNLTSLAQESCQDHHVALVVCASAADMQTLEQAWLQLPNCQPLALWSTTPVQDTTQMAYWSSGSQWHKSMMYSDLYFANSLEFVNYVQDMLGPEYPDVDVAMVLSYVTVMILAEHFESMDTTTQKYRDSLAKFQTTETLLGPFHLDSVTLQNKGRPAAAGTQWLPYLQQNNTQQWQNVLVAPLWQAQAAWMIPAPSALNCSAGSFWNTSARTSLLGSACQPCPPNTYSQDENSDVKCTPCRAGSTSIAGQSYCIAQEDPMDLSHGAWSLGIVVVSLSWCMSLACLGWMIYNSHSTVVQVSQWEYLSLICVGAICSSSTVLALSFEVTQACQVAPFLYSIGWVLQYASLSVKTYRLYKIKQYAPVEEEQQQDNDKDDEIKTQSSQQQQAKGSPRLSMAVAGKSTLPRQSTNSILTNHRLSMASSSSPPPPPQQSTKSILLSNSPRLSMASSAGSRISMASSTRSRMSMASSTRSRMSMASSTRSRMSMASSTRSRMSIMSALSTKSRLSLVAEKSDNREEVITNSDPQPPIKEEQPEENQEQTNEESEAPDISFCRFFQLVVKAVLVDVAFVLALTLVNPLVYEREEMGATIDPDTGVLTIETVGRCRASDPDGVSVWAFFGPILGFHVLLMVLTTYLLVKVRHMGSKFQESKYISIALVVMVETFVIGVPLLVAVRDSPSGIHIVMTVCICLPDMAILGVIFFPKMFSQWKYSREKAKLRKERQTDVVADEEDLSGQFLSTIRKISLRPAGFRRGSQTTSQWDQAVATINELLNPKPPNEGGEDEPERSIALLSDKTREQLESIKVLLMQQGDAKQGQLLHLPLHLLRKKALQGVNQSMHVLKKGLQPIGQISETARYILKEFGGFSPTIAPATGELAKPTFGGYLKSEEFESDLLEYVLPEFMALPRENQMRLFRLLSWSSLKRWEFNVFDLLELTNGKNPLLFVGWAILGSPHAQYSMGRHCGVMIQLDELRGYNFADETLRVPAEQLCDYLRVIEQDYKETNPYHNQIHAADVVQTVHTLIQMIGDSFPTTKLDIFAILLAAAVHDVKHPGENNSFQANARTDLALLYNDHSILENRHISHAFQVMLGDDHGWKTPNRRLSHINHGCASPLNPLCNATPEQLKAIRAKMIDAVLHTDMSKHFASVSAMKALVMSHSEAGERSFDDEESSWKILCYILHVADISNPAKPDPLFKLWTDRCLEEFFAQGDKELKLGLPISPNCDRTKTKKPDSQLGFIAYVIMPAYEVLATILDLVEERILPIISSNIEYWKEEKQKAVAQGESTSEQ